MNGSVAPVRRAGSASVWRLKPWPHDPSVRLLAFVDYSAVPTSDDLHRALAEARRQGARAVRTSAMFPRSADVAIEAGFEVIDTLALLRLTLDGRHEDRPPRTRPMRAWHYRAAADIDHAAFGSGWGNDASSLADIRHATPVHRARLIRDGSALAGFAISGAGGDNGYVQRVAVADAFRRRGIARSLVIDALAWMRRSRLAAAYVNTGVANTAALALYEGLGFSLLDERLTIAEHRLGG